MAWAAIVFLISSLGTATIAAANDGFPELFPHVARDPDDAATKFAFLGPESPPDPSSRIGADWVGLTRDTALLLGYQLAAVGTFYLLPETVSKWSSEDKDEVSGSKWLSNVQQPRWDNDHWFINVGHSYFGAIYYIRARERGFDKTGSFVYATVASAAYEFGVEALFERPSYQDLIVTPVGGALLAMLIFEPLRTSIKSKAERRWYDELVLFATDPLGVLNGAVERLLGIKSEIRVSPRAPALAHSNERRSGMSVELRIPWP